MGRRLSGTRRKQRAIRNSTIDSHLSTDNPRAIGGAWEQDSIAGLVTSGMLVIGEWGAGDADAKKMYTDIVDDQIHVVIQTFMGLSLSCARCHDHKFDPLTTRVVREILA